MIEQNTTINMIEQLWYTWSDVGLSTIRAGFRIRAASAGLHDIRSSRVQKLDRYQRYALPRGLDDLAIPTSIAPACLSLISTGEEHILVQKVYTGKDAVGRDGAFFVHLLAGLPENFSAQDAIALWKSPYWQVSDVQLRREETLLDRVSLEDLLRQRREITPGSRNLANIQSYLPYIIQVYLTKKLSIEPKTGQSVSQKLYIAAPDEDIALLISGLTQCLPTRILKDLTFSTYEPNVAVATTEIVGTCWLSTPVDDKMPYVERLLPAHYLQEKLAINCYTGVCSRLMDNPLLETRPLAGKFALDATKYFVRRCTERFAEKFTLLLELSADLTVDEFLEIYESLILKDEDSIKLLLSSSDYAHVARMLARPAYQQELIVFAISNPAWWRDTGKSAVTRLQKASYAIPVLQQALLDIAQLAINRAVVIVRGEDDLASELFRTGWWITEEEILQTIIDVLDCTTPSYQVPEIWNSLLQELLKIVDNFACLTQYWKIYARLMKIWSTTLPSSMKGLEQIEPLLAISWEQFGAFLALRLPFSWTEEATKNLISAGVPELDTENANELAHNYHPLVADLLQRFAQNVGLWSLAEALFKRLAEGQYARRLDLLYILLDSAMGEQDDIVMQLLSAVQLTEIADQVHFLEHYAQRYLVRYPDSPALSEYIRAFLAYLPTAGGDIFIGNTPSPTEQFLQLLTGWFFRHALPSDSADRYTAEIFAEFIDWYTVGILLRQPSLLQLEKLVVANCIGRVLSIPHISLKMRIPIIANLAVACVENERGLAAMIATMRQALRPTDLMDLLDQVARTVRQNIVAQRYPKARF